jgi:hypothetical protein
MRMRLVFACPHGAWTLITIGGFASGCRMNSAIAFA